MTSIRVPVKPRARLRGSNVEAKTGLQQGSTSLAGPIVDPEPAVRRSRGRRRSARTSGLLRRLVLALVVLALLPLGLTLLYALPLVHPISTLMLKDAVTLAGYDRRWVAIDDIAPVLRHSVIMSEDGQYCAHHGVDLRELKGVIDGALSGESTRGASTIPMQTAKNLFLWHGRSFVRKGLELPLAVYMDAVLSKKRMMEIYLNVAEWAPGVYGAEAAARHHFGRSAKDLTRRQAALLAVTLPNPAARNPGKPSAGLNRLAARIERRAAQSGAYVACVS